MGDSRPPVSQSDLYKYGNSLEPNSVSARQGLASALADVERGTDQAKVLHNFQMVKKRYVWTTHGIGYTKDNAAAINSGARLLEFGKFYDSTGALNLLVQAGANIYPYNTSTHTVGSAISLPYGIDSSAVPCMRPYSPSTQTTNAITVWCNGVQNPIKITSTSAASALTWTSPKVTQTLTFSGVVSVGGIVQILVYGTPLSVSPTVISYTPISSDTLVTVASAVAALFNSTASLTAAGISATSSGNTITVSYPTTTTLAFSTTVAGQSIKLTNVANGGVYNVTITSSLISGGSTTATYTANGTDTNATAAIALAAAINASTAVNAGCYAIALSNFVTVFYPSQNTVTFAQSTSGGPTITLSAGNVETDTISGSVTPTAAVSITFTSSALTGSPVSASYTQVTGDTLNTVAAALAAKINATTNLINAGIAAIAVGPVVTMIQPASLSPQATYTSAGGTIVHTLAAGQSSTATTIAVGAASATSQTWPLTFNGKTYQKPKFCENFGDRMVFAGFPDASTQYDVIMTNQGSAEKFTVAAPVLATDAFAFTVRNDLGPITGIKSFQPNTTIIASQTLVIGQRDGVSMLIGDNTTNYKQALLTTQFGILNNRCFAQVLDDLIFMTDRGVYSFSSLLQNQTEPTDALSYVVSDRIKLIDYANAADMFCTHHPITQEVQFWFPYVGDSGQNNRALVFCYNTDGGSSAPVWSTKDLGGTGISCAIDLRNTMYGGSYDGYVQLHYNTDTYDGNTILFQYVSSLATFGNLMQAGRLRNVTVVTDGDKQQFAINTYCYSRFMDGSTRRKLCTPAAFVMGDKGPGQTQLPFALGNSSFPSEFVKTHQYGPIGRGLMFEFELTNTSTSGDGLDYSCVEYTLSIGGLTRR